MTSLSAIIRDTKTKGDISKLRSKGFVPGILYGGIEKNQKIYLKKKTIKNLIYSENFLSNVLDLEINGKKEKVLPRDISFDTISDEPIHIDLLRIVEGKKLILEIPVKFINSDKSPGLKKGGVLNIVRRKIELKCPSNNIPKELLANLENTEIGSSIKISSINLPENVFTTIQGRDFVIATIASPTVVVEPEKPAEETTAEDEATTVESTATESTEKIDDKDKKIVVDKQEPNKKQEPTKKQEPVKK